MLELKMLNRLLIFLILTYSCIAESQFTGVVKPKHDVGLGFALEGLLSKRLIKEGDQVKAGQALLKIDSRLQSLETQRRKLMMEDKSKLESIKKEEAIIKKLLETTKRLLHETGSISEDEVNKLKIRYFNLLGTLKSTEILEQREIVEYDISKQVLENYTLRSPINGIVTAVKIDVGEWVRAGDRVIRVVDSSVCKLDINVEEHFARFLKKGGKALVRIASGEIEIEKEANIIFVSPVADQASGLVLVRAEFSNQDGRVKAGTMADVIFPSLNK
jgi:RND family efflux transporter MFP subunit